jgi:hypothetical protein
MSSETPPSSGGASLFDKYSTGSKSGSKSRRGFGTTRAAELRAKGLRITCYLNCEGVSQDTPVIGGPRGHGTVVKLPDACDTIAEVMIKIQAALKLDGRMLYASELWMPDGSQIKSYKQLIDATLIDSPIIVGCGEPFDGSRVPADLLAFHREGGGKVGRRKVHKTLKTRRKEALREKAETVRASGHGINSEAVAIARVQNVEDNREQVRDMQHKYMESLLIRAAQQEDLMSSVKQNIEFHKLEAAESRARQEEMKFMRHERLASERRATKEQMATLRARQLEKNYLKAENIRQNKKTLKQSKPHLQPKRKPAAPPELLT